jgi:hypothetical protein
MVPIPFFLKNTPKHCVNALQFVKEVKCMCAEKDYHDSYFSYANKYYTCDIYKKHQSYLQPQT